MCHTLRKIDDVLPVVQGCGAVVESLGASVLAHIELTNSRV